MVRLSEPAAGAGPGVTVAGMNRRRTLCSAVCGLLLGVLGGPQSPGWAEDGKAEPTDTPTVSVEDPAVPIPDSRFTLAGTMLTDAKRAALITLVDDKQNEIGSRLVPEGDTIEGFRLARVEPNLIWLERDGQRFVSRLGGPPQKVQPAATPRGRFVPMAPGERVTPSAPFQGGEPRRLPVRDTTSVPPEKLEGMQKAAGAVLERIQDSPEFQKSLEKLRPIVRERMGLPPVGSPASPASAGPTAPLPAAGVAPGQSRPAR
jgi:hypothetical protein